MKYLFIFLAAFSFFPVTKVSAEDSRKEQRVFNENKGQIFDQEGRTRTDILFAGTSDGLSYFFRKNGISYQLYKPGEKGEMLVSRIDMTWVGADPAVTVISKGRSITTENFYNLPNSNGITGVGSFDELFYKNIYQNIDLNYYYKDGSLKYDFIVKPYTDYTQIRIQIRGASSITQNADGTLSISTPSGTMTEGSPVAYQGNKEIKTNWVLNDSILSFRLSDYDPSLPVIIDPLVYQWQSFTGGDGVIINYIVSTMASIVNDASGNIYGVMNNLSFVPTLNPYNYDSKFVKYNSSGSLVWSIPMAPTVPQPFSVCVEGSAISGNSIYACGSTTLTTNIATSGAYQTTMGGGLNDCFLAKYDTSGNLIWRTYYGGSGSDSARGCKTDDLGNIYITGSTTSANVMASTSSYQNVIGGLSDAFVAKFNANGIRQWGTYYGGAGNDGGKSIDVKDNKIIIGGYTNSVSGIASAGAQQNNLIGNLNGVLICMDTAGSLLWGTYYGSDSTIIEHCAISNNAVYICGTTKGSTNIATSGTFQPYFGGDHDGFAVKFNMNGVRQWGTYYGGSGFDDLKGCTADYGSLFLCGSTNSSAGISTPASYNEIGAPGVMNAYVAELDTVAGARKFGSYNNAATRSFCCLSDGNGAIFVSGSRHTVYSNYAGFLTKFNDCNAPVPVLTASTTSTCSNVASVLSTPAIAGAVFQWYRNDTLVASNTSNTYSALIAGSYKLVVLYMSSCPSLPSSPVTISVMQAPTTTVVSTNAPCANATTGSITVTASGGAAPYSYAWDNSANTTASLFGLIPGSYIVHTTDANGCIKTDTVNILNTNNTPSNQIIQTNVPCYGASIGSITITATSGTPPYTYAWDNLPDTTSAISGLPVGTYVVHTSDVNSCMKTDTIIITQNTTTPPSDPLAPICAVTVDSATGKNLIVWEKSGIVNAYAYNLYRETSTAGQYELIGTQSVSDFSTFLDLTSLPLQQSYIYKIAEVDSCNHEWPLSSYHKTIHLSANVGTNGEINLNWNPYEGKPYSTHDVMRSFNGGPFMLLNQVSSSITSYTDLTPPDGNCIYRIEIDLPTACTPSKPTNIQHIQSNALSFGTTGINDISRVGSSWIAPNPTMGMVHIYGNIPSQIRVYDATGRLMLSEKNRNEVDLSALSKSIYLIRLYDKDGILYYSQRIVLN